MHDHCPSLQYVQSGKETWQYRIFFQKQTELAKWIKTNKKTDIIVNELHRLGMIGDGIKDAANIFGPQVDELRRIMPVIEAMLSKVALNVARYEKFRQVILSPAVAGNEDFEADLNVYLPKTGIYYISTMHV